MFKEVDVRVVRNVLAAIAPLAVGCVLVTPAQGVTIFVQNSSFESPGPVPQGGADTVADNWNLNGSGETFGPFAYGAGIFSNPPVGSTGHLNNVDQNQAAYIYSTVGNSITQPLITFEGPNAPRCSRRVILIS